MKQKYKYRHLTSEQKEVLWVWFKSQQEWHERQPISDWHKRQAVWFKNNAKWLFTLTELVTRTIKKHMPALIRNIVESNALIARIKERRDTERAKIKLGA
jgi:hypothetical protein